MRTETGKKIICFEVNDWYKYPKVFDEWFDFSSKKHEDSWVPDMDKWAKDNNLCIKIVVIDISVSLVVTAPWDWVEKNIPEFSDQRWLDYCEFKYPSPFFNDQVNFQLNGIEYLENEEYSRERRSLLETLHHQFSDEELENLKPHNILASPSGELFLDYAEENFGAMEWQKGKVYGKED